MLSAVAKLALASVDLVTQLLAAIFEVLQFPDECFLCPDLIRPVIFAHLEGRRDEAVEGYSRLLPVINHENRQCGFRAAKEAMVEGGVIKSAFCRHPIAPLHPQTRQALIELMDPHDPVVLRWGK